MHILEIFCQLRKKEISFKKGYRVKKVMKKIRNMNAFYSHRFIAVIQMYHTRSPKLSVSCYIFPLLLNRSFASQAIF